MGNFLVVSAADRDVCGPLFRYGIRNARLIKGTSPARTVETDWARGAAFPRANGSGGGLATDPATGSWLLACGTWFHDSGASSGEEEKLLARHLEAGPKALAREMHGFFVLAIGDARTREVLVITDAIATRLCFVRSWKGAVAIGGSSLVLGSMGDAALDPVGVQEYLRHGILYEDRTVFRDVRRLDAATIHRWRLGQAVSKERYWSVGDFPSGTLRGDDAVEALDDALQGAARRISRRFPRLVSDLTAGYDSRMLATGLLNAGVEFTSTVTGGPCSPDVVISRELAAVAGLEHLYLPLELPKTIDLVKRAAILADGEYDPVEYGAVQTIHGHLSSRFDASLNGSAGEVARGLWWNYLVPFVGRSGPIALRSIVGLRFRDEGSEPSLFPAPTRLDLASHFTGVLRRATAPISSRPNTLQADSIYLDVRMRSWQGRIATSTDQIWPCLSPFLFRPVVETILSVDVRSRMRSLLGRKLMHSTQPAFARVPLARGYPAVPFGPSTAHLFWGLPLRYAKRAFWRARRLAGFDGPPSTAAVERPQIPERLHLWLEDEVRETLQPRSMKVASLLDPAVLEHFLERSTARDFQFDGQWRRLLGLELTQRIVARVQAAARPESAAVRPAGTELRL